MSDGGEGLDAVIGRGEEEELPRYQPGAFQIDSEGGDGGGDGKRAIDEGFLEKYLPHGAVQYHTMRALMESMRVIGHEQLDCTQVRYLGSCICSKMTYSRVVISILPTIGLYGIWYTMVYHLGFMYLF